MYIIAYGLEFREEKAFHFQSRTLQVCLFKLQVRFLLRQFTSVLLRLFEKVKKSKKTSNDWIDADLLFSSTQFLFEWH